ncbi:uncharacterized protein VTP21DRAFT_11354 [Calcarisporiella thermophila]|uniref:uncharacterized protein n=1 Tax=Calcarisporiella thermophila TaxID=911321 RepID=UPI003744205E
MSSVSQRARTGGLVAGNPIALVEAHLATFGPHNRSAATYLYGYVQALSAICNIECGATLAHAGHWLKPLFSEARAHTSWQCYALQSVLLPMEDGGGLFGRRVTFTPKGVEVAREVFNALAACISLSLANESPTIIAAHAALKRAAAHLPSLLMTQFIRPVLEAVPDAMIVLRSAKRECTCPNLQQIQQVAKIVFEVGGGPLTRIGLCVVHNNAVSVAEWVDIVGNAF